MLCCLSNFLHMLLEVIYLGLNTVYSDKIAVYFSKALSTTSTRGVYLHWCFDGSYKQHF